MTLTDLISEKVSEMSNKDIENVSAILDKVKEHIIEKGSIEIDGICKVTLYWGANRRMYDFKEKSVIDVPGKIRPRIEWDSNFIDNIQNAKIKRKNKKKNKKVSS